MSEVFSFNADGRLVLLETLATRERPVLLRVVLHGDARALAGELGLRLWQGRVLSVTPANLGIDRVLMRLASAKAGRVEIQTDDGSPTDMASAVPIRRGMVDADQAARALDALLAPLGGPGVTVVTHGAQVMKAAAQLGKGALTLANQLLDVPKKVGDVLAKGSDDLATARLLDQLRDLGVLEIHEAAPPMPSLPPKSGSSIADRSIGRARGPTMRSRPPDRPQPLEVPEAVDDEEEDGPTLPPARVSVPAPAPAAPARISRPPPLGSSPWNKTAPRAEIPEERDENTDYAAAGIRGPKSSTFGWLAAIVVAVALVLLWRWQSAPPPEVAIAPVPTPVQTPPPPSPPEPKTATVTAVVTPPPNLGQGYSLSRPPPLAGPEADRRFREAERLINAGRYDEAEAILAPLRISQAGDPLVWLLTGQLEIELGRFSKASAAIDKAIAIDPKSYRGHILRGSIAQFQGSGRQALKSYKTALAISPNHAMSAELRGVADRLESSDE